MQKRFWLSFITLLLMVGLIAPQAAHAATGSISGIDFCRGTLKTTFTFTGVSDDGGGVDWVAIVLVADPEDDGSYFPLRRQEYAVPVGKTDTFTDTQTFPEPYPDGPAVWLMDLDGGDGRVLDQVLLPADVNACGCSTQIDFVSADPAPITGNVFFFTGFKDGEFWPGAEYHGHIAAVAGRPTAGALSVPCNTHVRAWLYNASSSVVGYVPSQYENGDGIFLERSEDYGTGHGGEAAYVGRYSDLFPLGNVAIPKPPASAAPVPDPLPEQKATILLEGGVLMDKDLGNGLMEWGYWSPAQDYILLGWSKTEPDGTVVYAASPDGPFTDAQFQEFVTQK